MVNKDFADRPWDKIAADLFKSKRTGKWYMIVTDYFSRFFEIFEMRSLTEEAVIYNVKTLFSRYGRCDVIRTDGGPKFQSKFKRFDNDYYIKHITSSPSNEEFQSAVKVAKALIEKNDDIQDALLEYRSTNGFSPAELLMGRKLKNAIPLSNLSTPLSKKVSEKEAALKSKQVENNKRHRVVELKQLPESQIVWITDLKK